MDEMVRAALAKWPDVPDCYGWLALDARGQWRLGQERQGITNAAMNEFIGRNYFSDEMGRWLFQNGPQRVFVDLDCTPWIWRIVPDEAGYALSNQIGQRALRPQAVWLDEQGRFLALADDMIGVVHDHDAALMLDLLGDVRGEASDAEELSRALIDATAGKPSGLWVRWPDATLVPLGSIASGQIAQTFHFEGTQRRRPIRAPTDPRSDSTWCRRFRLCPS